MQWGRRGVAALVTTVATTLVVAMTGGPAGAVAPVEFQQRFAPVLRTSFADPAVAAYRHGYVAVSTGPRAPRAVARTARGPWRQIRPALARLPRWARSGSIWAADIERHGHSWTLYYAAVAHGERGRCIGVARARTAMGAFRPVGRRPLVCPRRGGVIDPSTFVDRRHRRYLLYRTQGLPASIRIVRLTRDGLHRHRPGRSRLLVRRPTIVENPLMVRRGRDLVLITSEGYYGRCGYRTTWRRARHVAGLGRARSHVLLDQRHTGLCGPGGADLVRRNGRASLYFHAWTCGRGRYSCPVYFLMDRHARPDAHRAMYAARLRWRHGRPVARVLRRS